MDRSTAIWGNGVSSCVFANKVSGVPDPRDFSGASGVKDDDLRLIRMGGLAVGYALVSELAKTFFATRFSGFVFPKPRGWKEGRQKREKQFSETIENIRTVHLAGLHRRDLIASGGLRRGLVGCRRTEQVQKGRLAPIIMCVDEGWAGF